MSSRCLLIILIFASACAAQLVRLDTCEPDCFGKDAGDLVPDLMNCTNFYICLGNDMHTEVPIPCPSGEIFDPATNACGPGSTCTPACRPQACHLTCNGSLDTIADAKNCSIYYFCQLGGDTIGPMSCPPERPVFDGEYCITDRSKCCMALCTPYCFAGMVQIPDPSDCTKYYICLEEGFPDSNLHFQCDPGQHFDITSGMCAPGTTCNPLCPAGGTTVVPPVGGCISSLTCTGIGYFPQCNTCKPGYFDCQTVGQPGALRNCSGNLVFNTDPNYPYCILPTNCPYTPPS